MRVGVMCGARWYRGSDWKMYPLVWVCRSKTGSPVGFGIGPILFWNGT